MALGSGLGSSFGVSPSSTYSTYVAPTKFVPHTSANARKAATRVQGTGIQASVYAPLASHHVETTQAGTGDVAFDVTNKGLGVLLQQLMGTTVTPAQQTGAAYLQAHTFGDPLGKSMTVQVGAPYRSATVRPHTLVGAKITQATFSCDVAGILTCAMQFDAHSWTDGQNLASVSYPSGLKVFSGNQMTLKLGTLGAEAAVSGVKSVSVVVNRQQDVADYTAGASGYKAEPIINALQSITGSITGDWLDKTTFQDRANAVGQTSLVWEFVGALITTTYYETFRITIPSVQFEPATQGVAGPDVLTNQWNFQWLSDGTNLPRIDYISTDTSL